MMKTGTNKSGANETGTNTQGANTAKPDTAREKKLTHWKKAFNPEYIGSYAFLPAEEKKVTIQGTREAVVVGEGGRKERKQVVEFREAGVQPLILNRTNAKAIQRIAKSPYLEDWIGARVTLYVDPTVRGKSGEIVEGVRIRAQGWNETVPCADCGQAIQGTATLPAAVIAERSKEKYGAALCVGCGKKRKAAQEDDQKGGREHEQSNE